ncbi:hypothetical protein D2962_04195 [Biomaibacter acetigenes]|uniref:Uncharacterized protein n=1 Tax=Biomaibacter acetigenes TaxID=2316383 RepID=A0A3G2R3J1_9FIRM|nr:hypothetical protein [Biomaibacter acetigenes]AYO29911.1 hypothetical protein D2962_04195 [Biomaibacter acetigenes]MDN5313286.1 hypothetical protein [Thermoanaerobacteraceae bacterium]RKL64330.1 hypothetical protein DXT63_01040 [Thermoanaerobacteraceae bacterium SP2]
MNIKCPFHRIKKWICRLKNIYRQDDDVEVILPGLVIKLKRKLDIDTPHEVTVVVPRAEIRKKCLNEDCSKFEYELIYSSVTVVHAPRHPLAGPPSSPPEIPPRTNKRSDAGGQRSD